jgi:PAS domain S-box-containing protein
MAVKKKVDIRGKELSRLRSEAEKILLAKHTLHPLKEGAKKRELAELLHELQIYQVELEMQNDELRASQEHLERERQRVSTLFNLAPVGYFVLDEVAVIVDCNEMALNICKADRPRTVGKRFQTFVSPDSSDTFYVFLRRVFIEKSVASIELKLVTATGTVFFGQLHATRVIVAGSSPLLYVSVSDITEKRNAELRQMQLTDRLGMALKASSAGTWQIHMKTGKVTLDDFAGQIYGFSPAAFDGNYLSLLDQIHEDDRKAFDEAVRLSLIQEKKLHISCRVRKRDGSIRYVEARGHSAVDVTDNDVFAGLVMDVTERRELELRAALMQANQQKEIVKAIIETEENERQRISTALHDSVGQLLYAASLRLSDPANGPVNAVSETQKLLDLAIAETRNISFELAPSILTDFGLHVAVPEMVKRISSPSLAVKLDLRGVAERLTLSLETFVFRLLQELLNNVIKHAHATGVKLSLYVRKNDIFIRVRDNGIGFDTSVANTSGTGLHSIRNRISLYNGVMKIKSAKDRGTSVEIQLYNVKHKNE